VIDRHFDAEAINRVINHPAVYDWVRGARAGFLDLSEAVADPNNVLLMGEHGGVFFEHKQPGLYEAHTQVLPAGRGAWTVDMVRAALHWMFSRTDAVEIATLVPKGNLAARALAKAIGGRCEFRRERGWVMNGEAVFADVFWLPIQEWMRTAPELPALGHWFHERLEAEYARLGKQEPIHADDAVHDRYVGAAVAMMLGGQPDKGAIFYNRWACMAGYEPVSIVSHDPVVVDIRDALLIVRETGFDVAACR